MKEKLIKQYNSIDNDDLKIDFLENLDSELSEELIHVLISDLNDVEIDEFLKVEIIKSLGTHVSKSNRNHVKSNLIKFILRDNESDMVICHAINEMILFDLERDEIKDFYEILVNNSNNSDEKESSLVMLLYRNKDVHAKPFLEELKLAKKYLHI